jgi:beta-1,4-N-acetylglucosaminyltransferase
MSSKRVVFVTLGSTQFDALVATATSDACLQALHELGFTHMIVQYGSGSFPTERLANAHPLQCIEAFRLCASILPYLEQASLVLSHGGMSSTRFKRPDQRP